MNTTLHFPVDSWTKPRDSEGAPSSSAVSSCRLRAQDQAEVSSRSCPPRAARAWRALVAGVSWMIFAWVGGTASWAQAASPILIPRPPVAPAAPGLQQVYRPYFIPVEQVIPPNPFPGKVPPLTEKERADLARRWLHWQGSRGGSIPLVAPSAPLNLRPVTQPQLQRWVR